MTYKQGSSKTTKQSGFTLLELIIVVIIVGVLAGLALPKMQIMIRRTYITEAMQVFSILHARMEQAYTMGSGTYVTMFNIMLSNVDDASGPLAVSRPEDAPGAHFCYIIGPVTQNRYTIRAYMMDNVKTQCIGANIGTIMTNPDFIRYVEDRDARTIKYDGFGIFNGYGG
ncbi:MAG: prepilin-type N-terminal cleavage/methylation domain-containing protein [Candidatus Omnitrophica bacterium]|nr:prepilin-type N-terminal cleavage/methylation domain-containing protein [Candidatus Omnitrophota bacterium]